MATVTYNNESFTCTTALKGEDYIHLLDASGNMVTAFDGVVDFSGFSISDGDWTSPTEEDLCSIAVIEDDGTIGKSSFKPSDIAKAGDITPASIGAAEKSVAITASLPVASWNGGEKTLSVALSQDVTGKNLVVAPAPASFEAWCEAGVRANEQRSDGLGFTCTEIPTVDLTANILIIG